MKFYTDFETFEFSNPAQYPATSPVEMQQVRDRTAGGTTHVETYAKPLRARTLVFDEMSEVDYLGLLNWFVNVVNGMADTFNFQDERGNDYPVKFSNRSINFQETSYKRYKGSISVEVQNA